MMIPRISSKQILEQGLLFFLVMLLSGCSDQIQEPKTLPEPKKK